MVSFATNHSQFFSEMLCMLNPQCHNFCGAGWHGYLSSKAGISIVVCTGNANPDHSGGSRYILCRILALHGDSVVQPFGWNHAFCKTLGFSRSEG